MCPGGTPMVCLLASSEANLARVLSVALKVSDDTLYWEDKDASRQSSVLLRLPHTFIGFSFLLLSYSTRMFAK